MEMPRRYVALRWIGKLANVVAWVVVGLSVIALVWVLANVGVDWARTLLVGLVLLWGVSTFLNYFVRGNVLLLLDDLQRQAGANKLALNEVRSLLESARSAAAQAAAVRGPAVTVARDDTDRDKTVIIENRPPIEPRSS